jgi:hypothetical protein
VIYKNGNDQQAKKLVNSYRFRSNSPNKVYKRWSPDMAKDEQFKKKRQREDDYIQNFREEDRPILLIKNKHEYKGVENPDVFQDSPEDEHYFKISKNTQQVEDIVGEIMNQSRNMKKKTVFHPMGAKGQEEENAIYKVDGVEFLPSGFLELDPILYKDEYEFENKIHENMFKQDQRRAVHNRRKQYANRNQQKMRDVTIYILDEHKDKVINYLETWYFKHRRKMNEKEIL